MISAFAWFLLGSISNLMFMLLIGWRHIEKQQKIVIPAHVEIKADMTVKRPDGTER